MIDVHEVRVYLDNGDFVECYLEEDGPRYTGECFFPPTDQSSRKMLLRGPQPFADAEECYKWVVLEALRYASNRKAKVVRIDSPCNAPFIDKTDQMAVLAKVPLSVPVLVNGS